MLYKTRDNRLGRFPEAASDDLLPGPKRNFQIFDPLDFLAEVTQHIPELGEHLIRYYGWPACRSLGAGRYSNKKRGQRAQAQPPTPEEEYGPVPCAQRPRGPQTLGRPHQAGLRNGSISNCASAAPT